MNALITYLWVSGLSLWAVVPLYLLVRGTTWFSLNRLVLLSSVLMAMVCPFVPLHVGNGVADFSSLLPEVELTGAAGTGAVTEIWPWVVGAWALGTFFMLVRLGLSILGLMKALSHAVPSADGTLASIDQDPFSFFGRIMLPLGLQGRERDLVLAHEKVHVSRWHSLDRIIMELVRCVQWFNPVAHLLCHFTAEVHELEADAIVSPSGKGTEYAGLILSQAISGRSIAAPVNAFFNQSLIKTRMIMLTQKRTPAHGLVRHLALLPALVAMLWLNACADGGPSASDDQSMQDTVLEQAEKMPEFPGGMGELAAFLGSEIKYPESAKADSLEGKVFVSFCIATDGKVTEVAVAKGLRDDLDAEAVRAVSAMPAWTPGTDKGRAVKVRLTLPIGFKLS
jgi:TonB family protein